MLKRSMVWERWEEQNKNRKYEEIERLVQDVDPSKIIAINDQYNYPEILDDYEMKKLKVKIRTAEDWDMDPVKANTLRLLKFPNGEMIVNGNGNHRAVLANELKLPMIKARVLEIVYLD